MGWSCGEGWRCRTYVNCRIEGGSAAGAASDPPSMPQFVDHGLRGAAPRRQALRLGLERAARQLGPERLDGDHEALALPRRPPDPGDGAVEQYRARVAQHRPQPLAILGAGEQELAVAAGQVR